MQNKTNIRIKIKNNRKLLDTNSLSEILTEKVLAHPAFVRAKNVMLYYPMKYEIDLLEVMRESKNFYFPKVNGEEMLVCPACGNFEKSKMNIYEPCTNPVNAAILDLIIVPALAVDKDNYRLGYGGGFYDKFLAKYPDAVTLTAISKRFIYERLPRDEFDVPVDYVVTD